MRNCTFLMITVLAGCAGNIDHPAEGEAPLQGLYPPAGDPAVPYAIELQIDNGKPTQSVCSSVLIAQDWLLTAAHCIWDLTHDDRNHPENIAAIVGSFGGVDSIVVHPLYQPATAPGTDVDAIYQPVPWDAALLHLTSPQLVAPVPVEQSLSPGLPLVCYGFGETAPGTGVDGNVRRGSFTVGELVTLDGTSNGVAQGYLTEPANGSTSIQLGDSGGPCFEPSSDGKTPGKLTGIHSWKQSISDGTVRSADLGIEYIYGWIIGVTSGFIEDVVATYGENLGAAPGNATNSTIYGNSLQGPSDQLSGKTSALYQVDPTVLGDPYPGQIKDFVLSWTCGRVGPYGVWLGPDSNQKVAFVSCPASVTGIQVSSATYGRSCGASEGNATNALVAACDGHTGCSYTVDASRLGDPAPGCAKSFDLVYTCAASSGGGSVSLPAEAAGQSVSLHCCQPTSCAALGLHCGTASDGCGGTLDCGGCGSGTTCSGGQCVCQPRTACNGACGAISDGCGGTLQCPACVCVPSCAGKSCGASDGCGHRCSGYCTRKFTVCQQTSLGYSCLPLD